MPDRAEASAVRIALLMGRHYPYLIFADQRSVNAL
jgi:hypothetical protein